MIRRGIQIAALALGLGVAGTAVAQNNNKQGDLNVFLKGGVSDYTGDLGDDVSTGPAWGLAVNVQPTRILGFELGYDGSKNDVNNDLLPDASFTRHGGTGLVKLAPPLLEKVKPFVGAGLGVSYISVDGGAGLYDSDIVEEVPVAAGIEFNSGAVTAGLRATYRLLVDENVANDVSLGNPQGGLFDASFTLGGRF
ncbi:outer membrane beta-barrel protein [Hyalangium rubrum]|uniref:Outer membrane beta-barrel protein n=1 Tax=Hyalangium rubrum TaxID=3103134 RepID=A0ABU5H7D4_9BACT|nr:outer membrane beta-barrel protein [Hyalangium sp. s54d21]MDY7229382.1 outer membrane beta-barrel protein [Hyalangium sp. s54d21]